MKIIRDLLIVILVAVIFLSAPAQAITKSSILTVIPDDIYIHLFGGAAVAGWLDKHEVPEGQSWALLIAGSLAKEVLFDYVLFGSSIDLLEVGASLLGAFIYCRF